MPIILCQVFPSSATKKRPADQIKKVNALYLAAVKNDPQVHPARHVDALRRRRTATHRRGEFPDLLHPNDIGYAKWAAALDPVFATLGFIETTPDPFTPEDGFESLFNGRDLTGWGYRPTSEADKESAKRGRRRIPNAAAWPFVDRAPSASTARRRRPTAASPRSTAGSSSRRPPEGRKIQQLWTTREFRQDFILKLEFRATPNADSGVYLRGPQLQCRDYGLAGPFKSLKNYKPQDWNELIVTVQDGMAQRDLQRRSARGRDAEVPASGPIGARGRPRADGIPPHSDREPRPVGSRVQLPICTSPAPSGPTEVGPYTGRTSGFAFDTAE